MLLKNYKKLSNKAVCLQKNIKNIIQYSNTVFWLFVFPFMELNAPVPIYFHFINKNILSNNFCVTKKVRFGVTLSKYFLAKLHCMKIFFLPGYYSIKLHYITFFLNKLNLNNEYIIKPSSKLCFTLPYH